MPIPSFSPQGKLPHFLPGDATQRASRSPYPATMSELVEKFCTNPARAKLLVGLNEYRHHLFSGGFTVGSQWLDGSFVEDVEGIQKRFPRDIDVVTLFNRPIKYQVDPSAWNADYANFIHNTYFETSKIKPRFNCDAYSIDLDNAGRSLVQETTYWFGLFSDTRSNDKKGIVEIPLARDPMEFNMVQGMISGRFDV
jgi:hypothetical protein